MNLRDTRRSLPRLLSSFALTLVAWLLGSAARADVVLHAFDWSYAGIGSAAKLISDAGYRAVLVAPPMKSEISPTCDWYKRYQPQDFRVIEGCNGNKKQFVEMVQALDKLHVRVYADVVLNHMANERNHSTTFPGPFTVSDYGARSEYWAAQRLFGDLSTGLFSPQDFHDEKCIRDYGDTGQVVYDRICGKDGDRGLPDLRDTEEGRNWVLDQRKEYLKALFQLGVKGFRLDAAKHMPIGAIEYFVPPELAAGAHVFSEIITWGGTADKEYQLYLEPYLRKLPAAFGAYDFPLINTIKRAFAPDSSLGASLANPYADGNALEPGRAVTFVMTHDIPTTFRGLIMDEKDEELAYAYVLGRDGGVPLVFDDGSRERFDHARWVDIWKRDWMKRMISFHNRMHGKWMEVVHASDCVLIWRRQEDGIAAINKCGLDQHVRVGTNKKFKWHVTYRDVLTGGNTLKITSELHTFDVPARSARMWIAD